MLSVKNIRFNYPSQTHFRGIRGLSFEVDRGEVLAVVGKSGSGKTTLLKCVYGLEDVTGGSITLDGERVAGPSEQLMPGHPGMQLVSQDYYVLDNHTVTENITDRLAGMHDEYKMRRAHRLMRLLEILPLAGTKARHLSSGQKQRVAIARAIAVMPRLLLLDEPFNNLDKPLADKLITFIVSEVRKKKTGLILITHLAEEALRFADKVMVLEEGRAVQSGNTLDVYDQPRNAKLAGLLGACNVLRSADLETASRLNRERARLLVRPGSLTLTTRRDDADLRMTVQSSVFNGKCYEVRGETESGQTVLAYHTAPLQRGEVAWFRVNGRD